MPDGWAETNLRTARANATSIGIARAQYEHAIALLIGQPASSFSLPAKPLDAKPPSIPIGLPARDGRTQLRVERAGGAPEVLDLVQAVRGADLVWARLVALWASNMARLYGQIIRSEASTEISNLFLASDYVKTYTDVACMEATNEAARRAVNALLDRAASSAPLWPLSEPEVFQPLVEYDRLRFKLGLPHAAFSLPPVNYR
ncbi:MAG TPA: hypothetical protein VHZ55_09940 [Bryobacteraceae bacterium]|nr:hypothetical protein [Bryobacteraceae bacterium]